MRTVTPVVCVVFAAAGALLAEPAESYDMYVYMVNGQAVPLATLRPAQVAATALFAPAGLRLHWCDSDGCAVERRRMDLHGELVLGIRIEDNRPQDFKPGALAYARPFGIDEVRITVLFDRVRWVAGAQRSLLPHLLACVLVHEIAHVVAQTDAHSTEGVMKALWQGPDYVAMEHEALRFDPDMLYQIRLGLRQRAASARRPLSTL